MSSGKDVGNTIENVISDIDALFKIHEEEIEKAISSNSEPKPLAIAGFSKILQDYYIGIENIFELIARRIDDDFPGGDSSHRDLLNQMATDNKNRKPVISEDVKDELSVYLAFRHKSRHLYSISHEWVSMRPLLTNVMDDWKTVRKEIKAFVETL